MGNDEVLIMTQDHGSKRKTVHQLEALEKLYSEDHYPTQKAMEDCAVTLKLTYKQVSGWFAQKRRRERRENRVCLSSKKCLISRTDCSTLSGCGKRIFKSDLLVQRVEASSFSKPNQLRLVKLDQFKKKNHRSCYTSQCVGRGDRRTQPLQLKNFMVRSRNTELNKKVYPLQDMLPPDYILQKVFRKDGPPLGVEFDTPPGAFSRRRGTRNSLPACLDDQKEPKGRKVCKPSFADFQVCKNKSLPVKKHGIGKGLMTVWRATNPDAGDFPSGLNFSGEGADICSSLTLSRSQEPSNPVKLLQHHRLITKRRRLSSCDKKIHSVKRRKVEHKKDDKDENKKKPLKADCKLALVGLRSEQDLSELVSLVDDEELELRELRAGPNPVTCSAHLATEGLHSCSLCKDLLAKFPPHSVKMNQPFCTHPWDSSPELVKKLFKVFHFLYTYAADMGLYPFTLDEFAQAFYEKDFLLLGKVHVALLRLLLSDIETEFNNGFPCRTSKDCRFLVLLHSVEHLEFMVQFWSSSLNALTWTEIMCQVLVAAGFGSKQGPTRRGALLKEGSPMDKYGFRPGTLKGELFSVLSEQGNRGLKVSELAKALQIVELNLASTTDELERLIYSTLSSDITLFEKISTSAYRLRVNPLFKKEVDFQPNTEDFGSVDDESGERTSNSSADDCDESELDSAATNLSLVKYKGCRKRKSNMLTVYTEIDESHSGEVWVLGLMDGEFSDLSIEEKLNALVALVDLTSSGSSIRMEGHVKSVRESIPDIWCRGSGAKIKRSSAKRQNFIMSEMGHFGPLHGMKETCVSPEFLPVDSSVLISRAIGKENDLLGVNGSQTKFADATEELGSVVHPLQSVYLGSDRRYNRYWLFLGPCDAKDPGHRRVYFESSEDGHWEVIDTKEGLYSLLSVLDGRGTREAQLLASLEKREAFLRQAMTNKEESGNETRQSTESDLSEIDIVSVEGSSPVSYIDNNLCLPETANHSRASSAALVMELGKNGEDQIEKWNRLQAFDAWIWDSFYSNLNAVKHGKRSYLDSLTRCNSCHDLYWRDERHCKICHTTFELDFDLEERYTIHVATCREQDTDKFPKHRVLSSQLQSLKAAIHAIEAVIPEEAFVGAWKRSAQKLWVKRLRRASSMPEFLQVLTDFVGAVNEDWLNKGCFGLGSDTALDEVIVFFPTMPQTTSALALWLVKLDALIAPHLEKMNSKNAQENSATKAKVTGRPAPR